jgi:hypothetical protein
MRDEMDFKAVFIGIGNPQPKTIPIFEGLTEENGYYTSKGFLPKVKIKDVDRCKSNLSLASHRTVLLHIYVINIVI